MMMTMVAAAALGLHAPPMQHGRSVLLQTAKAAVRQRMMLQQLRCVRQVLVCVHCFGMKMVEALTLRLHTWAVAALLARANLHALGVHAGEGMASRAV